MNQFYVYEHWRSDEGVPFYVGKGKNGRSHDFYNRGRKYKELIRFLFDSGYSVRVRIVVSGLFQEQALQLEVKRIRFWKLRGVRLINRTRGGEQPPSRIGAVFTQEHRKKLSQKKVGVKRPPFTDETRRRMRLASRAREEAKRAKFGNNVTRYSRLKEGVDV